MEPLHPASKQIRHFVHPYFLYPTNPITTNLIGVGATGTSMLTALARINKSLLALGHPGLDLIAHDGDIVEPPNLGRQLFTESELGLNKAVALINRVNRAFGTRWKASPSNFLERSPSAQLTISCVDNVDTRLQIAKHLKSNRRGYQHLLTPYYWLDCGNDRTTGQAILSTACKIDQPRSRKYIACDSLPLITEQYHDLLISSEKESSAPSCSLAEALNKQDLFINTNIANIGSSLIWNMFRKGMLRYRGFFLNLDDFRMLPIPITLPTEKGTNFPQRK